MSGSAGPDYSRGGSGGGGNCAGLRRDKALQAPVDDVVGTISIGDDLELILHSGDHPTIEVLTGFGAVAGAIMPDAVLIECMEQGFAYKATVKSKNGGSVTLSVEPK